MRKQRVYIILLLCRKEQWVKYTHNISVKDKNAVQQKVIDQKNKCFIYNKDFNLDNQPSWDRIDCNLPHTLQNIVLTCVPCNIETSNRSLELMQTIYSR
jgi:hypothetical protein